MANRGTHSTNLSLSRNDLVRLQRMAEYLGMSRSAVVRHCIRHVDDRLRLGGCYDKPLTSPADSDPIDPSPTEE